MSRQETLDQVKQAFGAVPDYLARAPDAVLEQFWSQIVWLQSDGSRATAGSRCVRKRWSALVPPPLFTASIECLSTKRSLRYSG
jgi:hypothetical protein